MILQLLSGAECRQVAGWGGHLRPGAGRGQGNAGAGEDIEVEVAAAFGPFVVLLGQDGADEADQGGTAGEDPHDVGPAADLAIGPFPGIVRPGLPPERFREAGERQHIGPCRVQVLSNFGELVLHGVDKPVVLGLHRGSVRLVIDRVQQRLDPRPGRLRGADIRFAA